jgi:hypothetical protein
VSGVFEALIVVGLFLLIVVVAFATIVMARRSRNNAGNYQTETVRRNASTVRSGAGSTIASGSQIAPGLQGDRVDQPTRSEVEAEELRAKAERLLASAEAARTGAEEESRARRTELRE